jgi:outer membrane lipoprotein-sorting protein
MMLRFSLAVAFALPCTGSAQAQDAKTIVRNMVAAYRGLNSYDGRATADSRQTLPNGRIISETSFATRMIYRKPNSLKIEFTMPTGGQTVYYDGSTLTLFQDRTLTYTSVPVTAANLRDLEPALLRFQIGSGLDALYFLSGRDLPAAISGLARKPDQTRNGRPVYVVTGKAAGRTPSRPIVWTWMIDKQTNLLVKVEGRLSSIPQRIRILKGKKAVVKEIMLDSLLTQNIADAKPNAAVSDNTFVFVPPAGAKRQETAASAAAGKGR